MRRPSICAVITDADVASAKSVEPLVDLFEVRIDLIGERWSDVARELKKPWIACCRPPEEGGAWRDTEARRVEKLLHAIALGANIVDVELRTKNLENVVAAVKRKAGCLISHHDLERTPPLGDLRGVVARQVKAGADICKVVTTARDSDDNWTVLHLASERHDVPLVSFAMGPMGVMSRVLSPLVGGHFTYASIVTGKESAPGQVRVRDLHEMYETLRLA